MFSRCTDVFLTVHRRDLSAVLRVSIAALNAHAPSGTVRFGHPDILKRSDGKTSDFMTRPLYAAAFKVCSAASLVDGHNYRPQHVASGYNRLLLDL